MCMCVRVDGYERTWLSVNKHVCVPECAFLSIRVCRVCVRRYVSECV
jgi:hypothetical protein